jgi:ribosomal protein S1
MEGWPLGSTLGITSRERDGNEDIDTNDDNTSNYISHVSQLSVGQIVEAKVFNVKSNCIVMKIGERVRAICPAAHAFDSSSGIAMASSNLSKKFKVGQILRMRVWELDGSTVMLTNKKSLVECDRSQCIMTIDDAVKGRSVVGVISKISELGLQIHFFNSIKALVPMAVLVKQGVTDPEESFRVGQIAKCVVLSLSFPKEYKGKRARTAKPRITLSLDLGGSTLVSLDDEAQDTTRSTLISDRTDGEIVSGVVIKKSLDGLVVRLDDGRSATLEKTHLCDISDYSEASLSFYAIGDRIETALVLATGKSGLFLTIKPLFLSTAITSDINELSKDDIENGSTILPSTISELLPGLVIAGFVHKVEAYGVLIRFRNNVSTLVTTNFSAAKIRTQFFNFIL